MTHTIGLRPSLWLIDNSDLLPRPTEGSRVVRAIDVACGSGRHALWLAAAGFETEAVDRDADAISQLRSEAYRLGLTVNARVDDLERPGASLGHERYDVIVVIRYLHRPLFGALRTALRPNGLLVYETFTVDQAARGKPTNPAFLLKHRELPALIAPLHVLREREGDYDGAVVAGVVATKEHDDKRL